VVLIICGIDNELDLILTEYYIYIYVYKVINIRGSEHLEGWVWKSFVLLN